MSGQSGKRIIVNVDDLGLSEAVNRAVVHLAQRGRIQAASLMSGGHIGEDDVRALRQSGIDIGLHFDLTSVLQNGQPLAGSLKSVLLRAFSRTLPKRVLRDAVCRQLDAFENQIGAAPVFVDGHQHIHQFPQIREALLAETDRRYSARPAWRSTFPTMPDGKSRVIAALGGRTFARRLQAAQRPHNGFFAGVYGFDADVLQLAQLWRQWFAAAPNDTVTAVMCHPAVPDNSWQDDIKAAREREFAWLDSDEYTALRLSENVGTAFWRDLAGADG